MSTQAERGTKRTCQNQECGSRFYDLNRDPAICPLCQTEYELSAAPMAIAAAAPVAEKAVRKPAKKPEYVVASDKPEDAPGAEGEEELAATIEGDETPAAGDDDETFLEEEEEDGPDVSGIIGGPVTEPEEGT
jgi:uncharacterized protein (TIGR02300 family)